MNLLIVADKSDLKTYETVMKTAPNTSVLGAVSRIDSDFIRLLYEKYNPHAVLIDTSVPAKGVSIKDVIEEIAKKYPYMKLLVLTDEDDHYPYQSYYTVRGRISNLEIKQIMKSMSADTEYAVPVRNKTNEDVDSSPTEKLSNVSPSRRHSAEEVDKLSTQAIKSVKIAKPRKGFRVNPVIAVVAAVFVLMVVIIVILCVKLGNRNSDAFQATLDEAPSVVVETSYSEALTTAFEESSSTVYELNEPMPTVYAPDRYTAEYTTVEVTEPTVLPSTARSNNSSSTSETSPSNRAGGSSSNTGRSSGSANSQVNEYPGEVYVSYDDNGTYHNNPNNAVSSVSISYSAKTMHVDDTLQLTANIYPSTANQALTWDSTDSSVVSVNNNGFITAKRVGSATITAKANNGKSASCYVTVSAKTATNNVWLSATEYHLSLEQVVTITLFGTTNVKWDLTDNNPLFIKSISGNQVTFRARAKGNTELIGLDKNTGEKYYCRIYVS